MLPRQDKLWRDWADLDKEQWCRNKISKGSCEEYRAKIETEKRKLREQQSKLELSPPMEIFVHELTKPSKTNLLFLQCLKVELDSLSRTPGLLPSLGVEHFMRELAQIYEASKACDTAPPGSPALPSVMAQLLLDGFPMELMDGDAGCIPMDWVTDVLDEVRRMLGEEVRVLVLSVLGVQSTGKSTLLNIMFGLQFAVSSGRCTRGMFAHLVRVDDLLRETLRCDFFLVIDSEGLRAPEVSPRRPTVERDAELATLLIGLSDMVLFNLRVENAEELKDILKTALHAIIRMIDAGRKPSCLFIHQCSGDLSVHDKNAEGRESIRKLLEESTAVVTKLEGKELVKQFSEFMEYDVVNDNFYLPELWTSGLLVKPISSEYSDKVLDLQKYILEKFKSKKSTHTLSDAGPLCDLGKTAFVIRDTEHKLSTSEMHRSWTSLSTFVGDVVRDCTAFIEGYASTKISYSSKQWDELLAHIDSLLNAEYKGCNAPLKVDIKLYVCSIAVEAFTRLDEALLEHKLSDIRSTARDLLGQMCQSGNEIQNIAAAFSQCFIKPALGRIIHQHLGTRLVKMIREKSNAFSSRKHLQMNVLLYVLMEEDFALFLNFIRSHEDVTHDWVKNYVIHICKQCKFLNWHNICLEKKNILEEVKSKIENSVTAAKAAQPIPATVADLFHSLKKLLDKDVVFQHVELLRMFDLYPLVDAQSLERLSAAVVTHLGAVICEVQPNCSDTCDVEKTLKDLRVRPHRQLLWMLRGCGQQCPLCGAPCDRGGGNHREHAATVHYPQGFKGWRHHDGTFMCDVCTTSMLLLETAQVAPQRHRSDPLASAQRHAKCRATATSVPCVTRASTDNSASPGAIPGPSTAPGTSHGINQGTSAGHSPNVHTTISGRVVRKSPLQLRACQPSRVHAGPREDVEEEGGPNLATGKRRLGSDSGGATLRL
ncbi:unnamed protein product [Lampetra planeri]